MPSNVNSLTSAIPFGSVIIWKVWATVCPASITIQKVWALSILVKLSIVCTLNVSKSVYTICIYMPDIRRAWLISIRLEPTWSWSCTCTRWRSCSSWSCCCSYPCTVSSCSCAYPQKWGAWATAINWSPPPPIGGGAIWAGAYSPSLVSCRRSKWRIAVTSPLGGGWAGDDRGDRGGCHALSICTCWSKGTWASSATSIAFKISIAVKILACSTITSWCSRWYNWRTCCWTSCIWISSSSSTTI